MPCTDAVYSVHIEDITTVVRVWLIKQVLYIKKDVTQKKRREKGRESNVLVTISLLPSCAAMLNCIPPRVTLARTSPRAGRPLAPYETSHITIYTMKSSINIKYNHNEEKGEKRKGEKARTNQREKRQRRSKPKKKGKTRKQREKKEIKEGLESLLINPVSFIDISSLLLL